MSQKRERNPMFIVHDCWRDIRELKLDAEIATKRITECCEQYSTVKLEGVVAERDAAHQRIEDLRSEIRSLRERLKLSKPKTGSKKETQDAGFHG